jgi:tetratricopeptide (TPR) repeat protein
VVTTAEIRNASPGGYEAELARAKNAVAGLEAVCRSRPHDVESRVRLSYRLFHQASLTGNMGDFETAETAVRETMKDYGPREDLCLLKANLDFRFHRLAEVKEDLKMAPLLAGRFEGRTLLADIDFQEGRYRESRVGFEQLIEENRTWDSLARLAHWKGKMGEPGEADQLYLEAEGDLTAKEMRSFAWLELQRGVLAITHGHYEQAGLHYRRAGMAYPGHWQVDEHVAELQAAQGKFDEAVALLKSVIARAPKPELHQALGELYVRMGMPEQAQPWFDSAWAAYMESVGRGNVHYFHHLADFCCDAREQPAEAVKWARKDIALRSNFSTQSALAWALFKAGEVAEALDFIKQALTSGVRDAGIFWTASTLFAATGETGESERYASAANAINPHYSNFHMHH